MNKRLLIVSDAWHPQINGVVRTLTNTIGCIDAMGSWDTFVISPQDFPNFSFPGYEEISVSYKINPHLNKLIDNICPDYIHISVEGPLGIAARKYCIKHGYKFTTAYHTKFPEFIESRLRIPAGIIYPFFRWFHAPSSNVMTATLSLSKELAAHGFKNTFGRWSRGVDTALFNPKHRVEHISNYAVYVGRVSHEKNIAAFLSAETPMKKVVVGSGPQLNELKIKYPAVEFVGTKSGKELATYYANAKVFAFPSKTDTFGLVIIEALSSGTPVAAFNIPSPSDIIIESVGALRDNFSEALEIASTKDRDECRDFAVQNYTWQKATEQFLSNLVPIM